MDRWTVARPYTRPRMATTRDYYDILGVPRGASDDDIKRAFRRSPSSGIPTSTRTRTPTRASRRSTRPTRSSPTRERRQAYDTFGRAGVGGGARPGLRAVRRLPGLRRHLRRVLRRRARRPARAATADPSGADLRYDMRLTFDEAVHGTEKEIRFDALDACPVCSGSGAEPGTEPTTCPQCSGTGEIRQVRSTMLGQMVNVTPVPALPRHRPDRRDAVPALPRRGSRRAREDAAGHDPGRHRRRSPDPPERGGRGRARAAGRRATSTSSRTSRSTRS